MLPARRREILLLLLLLAIAAAPYLPALAGKMTNWDDDVNIASNPYICAGWRHGLLPLLTRPYLRLYIPVTYAVLWAGHHLWGANPLGYHIVNLLCHLAAVGFLYRILRRLLPGVWPAFLAAAWWAVHPLNVEPVAWLTGLKDVLSGALALLAWLLYMTWRERATDRNARLLYPAALAAFLLACLAKPAVVTLPLAFAAYDLFIGRRRGRALVPLVPFLAVSLAIGLLTLAIHRPEEAGVATASLSDRLFLAADTTVFYLEKAFWPSSLCPVYGRTLADAILSPQSWVRAGLVLGLVLILWTLGERWRLAGVLFLAALAPVSGVVPFGYEAYSTVADRYAYLPLVAVAIVLGDLLSLVETDRWRATATAFGERALVAVWVAVLAVAACLQTSVWRDSLAVWEQVIACNLRPVAPVMANYGSALYRAGRPDDALLVLRQCVEENPRYARARYNLARVLQALDRTDEALQEYTRVLADDPNYVSAWTALGALEAARGDYARSADASRRALELDDMNASAAVNLGLALLRLNRPAEAAEAFRRAVAIAPDDPEARRFLDDALRATSPGP